VRLWLNWWHDTAQIPLKIHDQGVAETKLRWWRQELRDAAQGQPHHPTLLALLAPDTVRTPARLPDWTLWSRQIDGLLDLIHQTRWLDEASLLRHMDQTTGTACESAACLLGASSEAALKAARGLGLGLRMAHRLARLGQDARAGWIQVPIDVLQAHEVRAHQLSKPDASQPPAGWPGLLAQLHRQASEQLKQALAACQALPRSEAKALTPLRVLAHIDLQLIDQIAGRGDRVLHERIVQTPLRKWWTARKVRWGLLR
jgi:phytoene synthase